MEYRPNVILNSITTVAITVYLLLLKKFNNTLLMSRRSAASDIIWAIESMLNPDFWAFFAIGAFAAAGLGYLSYSDLRNLSKEMNPPYGEIDTNAVILLYVILIIKIILFIALVALIVNPIVRILIIGIFTLAIIAGFLG